MMFLDVCFCCCCFLLWVIQFISSMRSEFFNLFFLSFSFFLRNCPSMFKFFISKLSFLGNYNYTYIRLGFSPTAHDAMSSSSHSISTVFFLKKKKKTILLFITKNSNISLLVSSISMLSLAQSSSLWIYEML